MKVGDLIIESIYPDDSAGLIVKIEDLKGLKRYAVLCSDSKVEWFPRLYIEEQCEVISAGR